MNKFDENIINAVASAGLELGEAEYPLVLPENEAEATRIFIQASKYDLKTAIRGIGTQSDAGGGRLIVGSARLNRIIEYSQRDLLLVAGAGLKFRELDKFTKEAGYTLGDYSGSLGGCLAGRTAFTAKRELISRVLGLTLVSPEGKVYRLGSKAVKDVAGYRIFPLLFGSGGRLGLITEVMINLAVITRDYSVSDASVDKKISDDGDRTDKLLADMFKVFDPNGILA